MAQVTFNENKTKRVPINRNSLFYDAQSFNYEIEMGKQYVEMDMGQTVVLYQVDASNTQSDAVRDADLFCRILVFYRWL